MKLVREILSSEKGKKVWSSVTPIYNNDAYNLYIFEAIGVALDEFMAFLDTLNKELHPQYATWSLELREELHGIKPDSRLTLTQRIQELLEEMNRYRTMTKTNLENIINVYVENQSAIIKELDGYMFVVEIPNDSKRDIPKIIEAIERNKPAHLEYRFLNALVHELQLGVGLLSGEVIEIRPTLMTQSDVIVPNFTQSAIQAIEIVNIYPKMPTEVTTQLVVLVDAGTHYIEKIEIA